MTTSPTPPQSPPAWPVKPYEPRHSSWPYNDADFARRDQTADSSFYSQPRFVTHIDNAAIRALKAYYEAVLPKKGNILDLCSSWTSHYPEDIENAATSGNGELKISGIGLNQVELNANRALNNVRAVVDLNSTPDFEAALSDSTAVDVKLEKLDATTVAVSVDYLTQPVKVLQSLREITKIGGTVHLIVSNRCFPTKVIARWLEISEDERLLMAGDFLHFAGWKKIEIVELSDGSERDERRGSKEGMALLGMKDPLWVVRAEKQ